MQLLSSIKYIIHLSDIHIGCSINRYDEYIDVFNNLHKKVKNICDDPNKIIIVVCGDIFHHKTRYSGEDINLFKYFIDGFDSHIVIIPGNHDANIKKTNGEDLIKPLHDIMNYDNVHYLRESKDYNICGLTFSHLSVFDIATGGKNYTLSKDSIFLAHSGIKSPLTIEFLQKFKLCLLGDIHKHEFVKDNIAYCGSLIQQNIKESLNKGFILWDVDKLTGKFITVPNKFCFVRLETSDNIEIFKREISKYDGKLVRKILLIINTTHINAEKYIGILKEKFPDTNISTRSNSIMQKNQQTTFSNITIIKDCIRESIKSKYQSKYANDIPKEKLNQYTEELTENYVEQTISTNKWTLLKLSWSNLFKYNESNCIDFTQFNGSNNISGVIAPNRAGKSAIFDIIHLALFNTTLRGTKKSIIRKNTVKSYIKLEFSVNDDVYIIERTDMASKSIVDLYKKVKSREQSSPLYENISKENVQDTYKIIRDLIGSKEEFLATGLYYNNLCDITNLSQTEKLKILSQLFGLTQNEELLAQFKKYKKAEQLKEKKLVVPRRSKDETIKNINKIKTEIEQSKQIIKDNNERAVKIQISINQLTNKIKSQLVCFDKYKNIEKMRNEIIDELKKHNYLYSDDDIKEYLQTIEKYETLNQNKTLAYLCSEIEKIKSLMDIKEDNYERNINTSMQKLSDIEEKITMINKMIEKNDALLSLNDMFKFNDNCEHCQKNSKLLNRELLSDDKEMKDKRNKFIQSKDKFISYIEKQKLKKLKYEHKLSEIKKYAKDDSSREQTKDYISLLEEKLLALEKQKQSYEFKKAQMKTNINDHKTMLYKKLQNINTKYYNAKEELINISDNDNQSFDIMVENMKKDLTKQNATLNELKQKYKSITSCNDKKNILLGELQITLKINEKEYQIIEKYEKEYPIIREKINKYKLFIDTLGNDGLRSAIVNKHFSKVICRANEILNDITNFQLIEDNLNIFIAENDLQTNIETGSGFQRFICSLALRLALTNVLPISSKFVMIDEGFGCLDETNLQKCIDFFSELSSEYDFIFIISHIDKLQNMLRNPLIITTTGKTSHVENANNYNEKINVKKLPIKKKSTLNKHSSKQTSSKIISNEMPKFENLSNGKVKCECGSILKQITKRHLTSKKHQVYLESLL